eukprot:2831587-Prymnesium_polylepis.1
MQLERQVDVAKVERNALRASQPARKRVHIGATEPQSLRVKPKGSAGRAQRRRAPCGLGFDLRRRTHRVGAH